MSLPGRLAALLLSGIWLLPTSPALAQIHIANGWEASDDGFAYATNDTFAGMPSLTTVRPGGFPAAISDIPGPDLLYAIHETLETGTRVLSLHDTAGLSWLEAGHTPLFARAVVDDEGATWMRQQHIVSLPGTCPVDWLEADRCVPSDLITELIDLAALEGTPVDPAPGADVFDFGSFASSGTVDRDGTLFSFAGDATVATTVSVRDDDTIVVRGEAHIGDAVGGRLRGYHASVIGPTGDGLAAAGADGVPALLAHAQLARNAGVEDNGVNRRVLRCPPSRQGWILSQYLINGVGRGIGPSVDPGLDGGIPVFVSEIIPLDCGAAAGANLPVTGPGDAPAAALVCGWTRPLHQPLTSTRNGQTVTSNSQLLHKYLVVTLGVSPEAAASLITRLEGGNGGDILSVGLDAIVLDSAPHPDAVAWLGEARVGVDTHGPKHYRVLQFTADGSTFDLVDQQRGLFGEAFDVGPAQKPVTNCPDFDFTLEDVPAMFPGGFASGDVTAWTEALAD